MIEEFVEQWLQYIYMTMKENESNMKYQLFATHQSLGSLSPERFFLVVGFEK